jgi:hypothetical protein
MVSNLEPLLVDPQLLQQAEQLCQERLKSNPGNRALLCSLAEVYRKQGKLIDAAAVYDRLACLDPNDREAGYMHAVFGGPELPIGPKGIRAAPFVLFKNFLPPECHDALLPFALSVREQFVSARAGTLRPKAGARETLEFCGEWFGVKLFHDAISKVLPSVLPRLQVQPFAIDVLDVQLRAYLDGHFYKAHMDAPANSPIVNRRVLNYVYYFHRLPKPYSGGELLVFDTDVEADKFTKSRFTRVVPEDNSIIFFVPNFYHCVLPVRCPSKDFSDSRFVINGHIYKRLHFPN